LSAGRILVVEDERIVARDLEVHLTRLGYTVVGLAGTGEEAIALAADRAPDVVLMDIRLAGAMDGIGAADLIRERVDVPVVYLTAYADDETLQRARVTEPFGYVLKPFEERELHSVIQMALYKHASDAKLRASERRYAVTLSSIGDAVIATDARGAVTFMNPIAEALTGWLLEQARGLPLEDVFVIVNEHSRERVESPAVRVLADGTTVGLANHTVLISRSGGETPIDDCAAPMRDDRGALVGVVLVFHDISERRRLEEEVRQSQKMEALGRLAAGVAHDFNNLLTAILGYGDVMLRLLRPEDELHEYASEIKGAAERAALLTAQLLAFSRKQLTAPTIVDLNRLLEESGNMLRRLVGEDVELSMKPSSRRAFVCADPGQLGQVILNLAVNARDAMPSGGTLEIATHDDGDRVLLTVTDSGHGMDARTKARVFEPFFTTKQLGHGTGLGLSTVYGIVTHAGGSIDVESEQGKGASFRVRLPRSEPPSLDTSAHESPRRAGGMETILAVDDDLRLRALMRLVLGGQGYSVVEARDGEEALRIIERFNGPLHLLVTDVVMPRMNGRILAERALACRPEMKVLYLSGYTDEAVGERGIDHKQAHFLQKPFSADALLRKVREMLES
jgi:two-component system, cell cycle sensor histidine kinase and response regulator CckA